MAVHGRPHLELLDQLVEGRVHHEVDGRLEQEFPAGDGEQGAVDVPQDGPDRQAVEVRLGFRRVRGRGDRPRQPAAVEVGRRVLFQ
jgi:hypothetical protein